LLASRQLQTIYKASRPVLCFTSCNAEPAHNTTKYFAPNWRECAREAIIKWLLSYSMFMINVYFSC
jgi:hypothetical protein